MHIHTHMEAYMEACIRLHFHSVIQSFSHSPTHSPMHAECRSHLASVGERKTRKTREKEERREREERKKEQKNKRTKDARPPDSTFDSSSNHVHLHSSPRGPLSIGLTPKSSAHINLHLITTQIHYSRFRPI